MKKKFTKLAWAMATTTCLGAAIADEPHPHQFAKDVDAFHAAVAPVWHARPGKERLQNACGKVDELARLATDIHSTDASKLVASITTMKTACQGKLSDVEGAFYDVHEAFHHLMDAKPTPGKR